MKSVGVLGETLLKTQGVFVAYRVENFNNVEFQHLSRLFPTHFKG